MGKKLFLIGYLFITTAVYSQDVNVDKYKALFTINFVRYIGWTEENKQGDFVIGVLKNQSLSNLIQSNVTGKKFGYQNFKVKYFNKIDDITDCQILYISSNIFLNKKNMALIKGKVSGTATLLLSETANGVALGSMINFLLVGNQLKFEIATGNIEAVGLKVSNALTGLKNAILK